MQTSNYEFLWQKNTKPNNPINSINKHKTEHFACGGKLTREQFMKKSQDYRNAQ